jgi:hypothetical protein
MLLFILISKKLAGILRNWNKTLLSEIHENGLPHKDSFHGVHLILKKFNGSCKYEKTGIF